MLGRMTFLCHKGLTLSKRDGENRVCLLLVAEKSVVGKHSEPAVYLQCTWTTENNMKKEPKREGLVEKQSCKPHN